MTTAPQPTTRRDAAAIGAKRYYPPTPCRYGHLREGRYTTTGNCVACTAARNSGFTRTALNTRAANLAAGMCKVTVMVHPDDIDTVTELAAGLAVARGLTAAEATPPATPTRPITVYR